MSRLSLTCCCDDFCPAPLERESTIRCPVHKEASQAYPRKHPEHQSRATKRLKNKPHISKQEESQISQTVTAVSFTIVVPIPAALLLPFLFLLGGRKDTMLTAVSFPLPTAFPKFLADASCVGRCFHMHRTIMPGKAEQKERLQN